MVNKGVARERALANWFWELGFAVVRGPASGGGVRRRFAPDLVVLRGGRIFVFEVKYRAGGEVYVDCGKLRNLAEFAKRAGGEAYLLVKVDSGPWKVTKIPECSEDAGTVKAPYDEGIPLDVFVKSIVNEDLFSYLRQL